VTPLRRTINAWTTRPWLTQLAREFVWPFCAAVAWVIYNVWGASSPSTITNIIVLFASAFFLASWAASQYFRVRKQVRLEGDLAGIQERIASVLEHLNATAAELTDRVTGGSSFAVARVTDMPAKPGWLCLVVEPVGKYPLYEVRATVKKLGAEIKFSDWPTYKEFAADLDIGALSPGQGRVIHFALPGEHASQLDLAVYFYARNGNWTQLILARKSSEKWLQATRGTRDGQLLYERIDVGYPVPGPISWPDADANTLEEVMAKLSPAAPAKAE
jgi:hypothetical protein